MYGLEIVSFAPKQCYVNLPSKASADVSGNRRTRSQTKDGRRDPSVHGKYASPLSPHILNRATSNGGGYGGQKAAEQSARNDWDQMLVAGTYNQAQDCEPECRRHIDCSVSK